MNSSVEMFVEDDYLDIDDEQIVQENYHEAIQHILAPQYGDISHEEVDQILSEVFSDMTPEEIENFWKSVGSFFKKTVPKLLPTAGAAVGTALLGPGVGTAVGGMLGNVAGNAISSAGGSRSRRRRPVRRRPTVRRTNRSVSAVPDRASSATTQLMSLLQNPQLLQSILGQVMAGQGTVPVGREAVNAEFGSFMNALECLAAEAAEEAHNTSNKAQSHPEYLFDSTGEALCDISVAEERAKKLLTLLNESDEQELMSNRFTSYETDPEWEYQGSVYSGGY